MKANQEIKLKKMSGKGRFVLHGSHSEINKKGCPPETPWKSNTKSDQPVQGTAVAHFQSQPPSYWLLEDNMNSIQITSQKGREYLIF
ncbi:hypothetical protein NC652_005249 [Populus alba x Populus x berolinensis]|uniref:Uncharacterized protein n=1 Tax=Populus alba x Populus x berolinensis TaxID=444605 RepID=A0AAD6RBE9_9ROSI|nr:hypothetical protein NC652_005249 [Populus alba x Populus x berolinensis]KAJ7005804.1 hypothetical protein NC653_005206 [Populus alba x Populus x berolinensis]